MRDLAAPSVKQRLAAVRHLFDWLVTGQAVPVNPVGSVRGPRHVVTSGQTPVLDPAEARALLGPASAPRSGWRSRTCTRRSGASGCGEKRAASGTRCRATTTSKNT